MGNIIVVDDEKSIRVTLKAFLEEEGHQVDTAEEAEAAIKLINKKPFDVALTDIILPKLSGVELLNRIREKSPYVQVIMMTGEPTLETAADSLRLGAVEYLQKPVDKHDALKAVGNALQKKHLIDEKLRLEKANRDHMDNLERMVRNRTHALEASEAALRYRAKELSALHELSRKVNESIAVEDVIQYGLNEIQKSANADMTILFLKSEQGMVLKGFSPRKVIKRLTPHGMDLVGKCLCDLAEKHNRPFYVSDVHTDERYKGKECQNMDLSSLAALPLQNESEIIGVLGIASAAKRDFAAQSSFFEALATEMSIGLKKSLLYEQVKQNASELQKSLTLIKEAETERIKLEEHLHRSQRMEAIGVLASGIAHDFNNILSAIIGYSQLAHMDIQNPGKCKENVEMVLTAAERAKELVRHILAFGHQSEEGQGAVNVTVIVKEAIKFINASLPATIKIQPDLDSNIPDILADPIQIHQVIMNLCTNALHAMQDGEGILKIGLHAIHLGVECTSISPSLNPGPYVLLSVKDNGHGMDSDTLKKIFDPYFTTKSKEIGTGLGLAVVHNIVKKHKGIITLDSKPGKGATFNLYFPSIEEVDSPIQTTDIFPGGDGRILFVDDEPFIVDIAQKQLHQLGYDVEIKTNSPEALSKFTANPYRYDLVISDIDMPGLRGDKLAEKLLEIRPDIPIILCTGFSDAISGNIIQSLGIRDLVVKPILITDLANKISNIFRNQKKRT